MINSSGLKVCIEIFILRSGRILIPRSRTVGLDLDLSYPDNTGVYHGTRLCWPTQFYVQTSLNPMPNAQVCVYLTVHITKLQLQITFPKPLYIWHSACIYGDPGRWKSWCFHCLWPWDSNILLTMGIDRRLQIYPNVVRLVSK